MTNEEFKKEIRTVWIYCSCLVPFWRKLFCSNKSNFEWFEKQFKQL